MMRAPKRNQEESPKDKTLKKIGKLTWSILTSVRVWWWACTGAN